VPPSHFPDVLVRMCLCQALYYWTPANTKDDDGIKYGPNIAGLNYQIRVDCSIVDSGECASISTCSSTRAHCQSQLVFLTSSEDIGH